MTRIVSGRAGGHRLAVPRGGTRPTSDRVREALFSTLESRLGGLAGAAVLDLYAGSGAVGLEAWSRGAARVVLVESAGPALRVLRANVAGLAAAGGVVEVVAEQVERFAATAGGPPFDVVFADPPYELPAPALAGVLAALAAGGAIRGGGLAVVERATRDAWEWPPGYTGLADRRYGETTLHYGRR